MDGKLNELIIHMPAHETTNSGNPNSGVLPGLIAHNSIENSFKVFSILDGGIIIIMLFYCF